MVDKKTQLLWIMALITLFTACEILEIGGHLEDPNPPSSPQFIPQSSPTDTSQQGIGPADYVQGIQLEWYSNKEEDVEGYYIYRAEKSRDSSFAILDTVDIYTNIIESNSYTDTLVNYYTNYFYYITAFDYGRNESQSSDTIRYMLTEGVDLVTPNGQIEDLQRFVWYDFNSLTNEYVIEFESLSDSKTLWISRFTRPNYGDSEQRINYNYDNQAQLDSLQHHNTYRWRIHSISMVDQYNCDISGAKSPWNYFSIE